MLLASYQIVARLISLWSIIGVLAEEAHEVEATEILGTRSRRISHQRQ
jgi:hypothetical protein